MFSNLLSFWKGKDFLTQVLDEFRKMLDKTEFMFSSVCEALIEGKEEPGLKEKIYAVDKEVNELQRDIRKRIVAHLSLQPTVDVPSCLLLMSVVKDAERLGDYAKNLYEVIDLHSGPVDKAVYTKYFDGLEKKIMALFAETKKVFLESYNSEEHSSWIHETTIGKSCDALLPELVKSDLDVNNAVCMALIARYYKRVAAHLINIATSVIVPISDLDYLDEKKIQEAENNDPDV